ncbi:MAG: PIN domain-containing protein [Alloacidobacterium sp.]|jgi:predicted nucleic acid-binding protein
MRYLLDVNALVALGLRNHEFHHRMAAWVHAEQFPPVATCSITELGFIRVLAQASAYGLSIADARMVLLRLKKSRVVQFTFIPDDQDVSYLPAWVTTAKQTTDGHLTQLARRNEAVLATLDGRIPDAYLIPPDK